MSADSEQLPPPNDSNVFESFCLDLWRTIWRDPNAQKNGRSGQPQAGVDVFGQQQGEWVGVQCKQKDSLLWTKVTVKELEAEVRKARKFKPALSHFILATTGPADVKVQERARQLTDEHQKKGLFRASVYSWREIWKELTDRPELSDTIPSGLNHAGLPGPGSGQLVFTASLLGGPCAMTTSASWGQGREAGWWLMVDS